MQLGLGTLELQTIEPEGWTVRQSDLDFAISTEARTIIEQEGIILLSYQPLQAVAGKIIERCWCDGSVFHRQFDTSLEEF